MMKFKKYKKKYRYTNTIRISFQLLILLLLVYVGTRPLVDSSYVSDFEAYCPFGGFSALMSKLNLGSLSCQMGETQIFLGVTLLLGAVIFGKLFCSYICPIGAITEWLGKIGERYKLRFNLPNFLDRGLRILKYALLYFTIYYTMTSSELFCKTFDPYLAVATGFSNGDLILYYAIPALVITILGSIFLRLFWCKYLCPLGAIANIFNNFLPSVAVIILYVIANLLGADLNLVWLVVGLVIVGALTETVFMRSFGINLTKVKRVSQTCTACGICDDKCPEGIEVSKFDTVNHVDCHLCTDCVYACPVSNTLTISNKKTTKYLAPAATIILIIASLAFSSNFELSTLSEKWGPAEKVEDLSMFETNIKTVKCFGSASSFKNQISRIPGIYGLDAFATSHDVKIYYNPNEINEEGIKKAIFSPSKQLIRSASKLNGDSLSVLELGVDKLFDSIDQSNLTYTLLENKGVFGYQTMFGEPVITQIYFNPDSTNTEEIIQRIETEEVTIKMRGGGETIREMEFNVEGEPKLIGKISKKDFQKLMFRNYDKTFNRYKEYNNENLNVLIFTMPDAAKSSLYSRLNYMTSHLSSWKGIVRFATRQLDEPTAFIFFDESKTPLDSVKFALTSPKMKVHFRGGTIKEFDNPFKINPDGEVKNISEIKL